MSRRAAPFWFVLPFAAGIAAAAPAAEAVRVTLAEALERAHAASARLAEFAARETAAEQGIRIAAADRGPQADVQARYARWSDIPEFSTTSPTGATQVIVPNIPDNTSLAVGVTLPLYTGGRIDAGEAAARSGHAAAGSDRRVVAADLAFETTAIYWGLVTAREAERVVARALEAYEAHLVDARNRENVGVAARSEVLAVQVERDRARLQQIRAAQGAAIAEADLGRLLDLPPGTPIEPTDELGGGVAPPEDLAALLPEALDARPERAALDSRASAEEQRAEAYRATARPQVGTSARWEYANPNRRVFPPSATWQDTWELGVGVSFTVWDAHRAQASAARSAAEAEALRRRLEDVDRGIRLEVASRRLELASALAAVPVTESAVEAAEENLRVSRERYREGVMPSSELLDAEVALLGAGVDRLTALARARVARAGLDRAVGR